MTAAPHPSASLTSGSPYVAYLYSYPHKTAYRPLAPARPLAEVWAREPRDAVFLYMHVPFCEMRCGFCNLFTTVGTDGDVIAAYLDALAGQASHMRDAVLGDDIAFAQLAIGGGTPTLLTPAQLDRLLDIAETVMGARLADIPVSVETSPATATRERLHILRARGVDRISIGVQSFRANESRAVGRAQDTTRVLTALDRIRAAGFPTLNLDLMYGLPEQTLATWRASLDQALAFEPEQLYLYPLYVRPLTGLGKNPREAARTGQAAWDEQRLALYRAGRAQLLNRGYEQVSMRMFRRAHAPASTSVYRCQEDGMVGLGVGARSYTRALHYSTEYAVGGRTIKAIIGDYIASERRAFERADYGVELDREDQVRRYAILSLLSGALDRHTYRQRFARDVLDDLPELAELDAAGLADISPQAIRLTDAGLERSDAIGPWLHSGRVRQLMATYQLQ